MATFEEIAAQIREHKKGGIGQETPEEAAIAQRRNSAAVRVVEIRDDEVEDDEGGDTGGSAQLSKAQKKDLGQYSKSAKSGKPQRGLFWGKKSSASVSRDKKKHKSKRKAKDSRQDKELNDFDEVANLIRNVTMAEKVAMGEVAPRRQEVKNPLHGNKRPSGKSRSKSTKQQLPEDSFQAKAAQRQEQKTTNQGVYFFSHPHGAVICIQVYSHDLKYLGYLRGKSSKTFAVTQVGHHIVEKDKSFHFQVMRRRNMAISSVEKQHMVTSLRSLRTGAYMTRVEEKADVLQGKAPEDNDCIDTSKSIWFMYARGYKDPQPLYLRGDTVCVGPSPAPLLFETLTLREELDLRISGAGGKGKGKKQGHSDGDFGTIARQIRENTTARRDSGHYKGTDESGTPLSRYVHNSSEEHKTRSLQERDADASLNLDSNDDLLAQISPRSKQEGSYGEQAVSQIPRGVPPRPPQRNKSSLAKTKLTKQGLADGTGDPHFYTPRGDSSAQSRPPPPPLRPLRTSVSPGTNVPGNLPPPLTNRDAEILRARSPAVGHAVLPPAPESDKAGTPPRKSTPPLPVRNRPLPQPRPKSGLSTSEIRPPPLPRQPPPVEVPLQRSQTADLATHSRNQGDSIVEGESERALQHPKASPAAARLLEDLGIDDTGEEEGGAAPAAVEYSYASLSESLQDLPVVPGLSEEGSDLSIAAASLGLDISGLGDTSLGTPAPAEGYGEAGGEESSAEEDSDSTEGDEEGEYYEEGEQEMVQVTYLPFQDSEIFTCSVRDVMFTINEADDVFSLKGKKLGMIEELGRGSQATVWKGTIDNQIVALKQVDLSNAKDKREVRSQLKYEVDVMKRCSHRNVIKYFGSFYNKTSQEMNIIMELIPGGSLSTWIQSYGCFSEVLSAHVIRQALEGLAFLHSRRILHRDFKPDNLMVDFYGCIKLVDFGIAVQLQDESACRHSSVGTPWYTAPEVINGEPYRYGCDVWSLGCTLIELLTGKPPYYHLNAIEALYTMTEMSRPPFPEGISDACTSFLADCFVRDWKERPTAELLLQHDFIRDLIVPGQSDTIFLKNE